MGEGAGLGGAASWLPKGAGLHGTLQTGAREGPSTFERKKIGKAGTISKGSYAMGMSRRRRTT
jgi:hypothetical protein